MEKIIDRFLRYVAFDTASNPDSQSQPSTNKQFALLEQLRKELQDMGVEQVEVDKNGYLMATIPSNIDKDIPAVGFISHVDTSPELKDYIGQTIITTDGTTLLGADDKAGVAEIMSAAEYIMEHPEFSHGEIKIGFTPDEEIGRGVDRFDVARFGAQYAYTMDGGAIGELEYENFNAAAAKVHIQGRNIHPGYAKDKMLNATLIGTMAETGVHRRLRGFHTHHQIHRRSGRGRHPVYHTRP